VLENAALLYAAGQPDLARGQLTEGVQNDADAKISPLAWLALFDLLQRADLRTEFDQYALQYVVQFERSAPGWEETANAVAAEGAIGAGGYVALSGKAVGRHEQPSSPASSARSTSGCPAQGSTCRRCWGSTTQARTPLPISSAWRAATGRRSPSSARKSSSPRSTPP
jgi:hypothetical protein